MIIMKVLVIVSNLLGLLNNYLNNKIMYSEKETEVEINRIKQRIQWHVQAIADLIRTEYETIWGDTAETHQEIIDALQNNRIYAAGLDVFNNEPNLDERYMKLDNCFVLPHVGSATHETRLAMSMMAVDNIFSYFNNEPLISEVV